MKTATHREMAEGFVAELAAAGLAPDPIPAHPLEPVAWEAFERQHCQEPRTLAAFMAGDPGAGRPRSPYLKVASEVLGRMESRGLIWRNDQGQYRPHQSGDDARTSPVRSPGESLAVLLEARDNCRSGLVGLRCRWDGEEWTIVATRWDADGELELRLDGGDFRPYLLVDPEGVTLLDPWPARCCKPSKAKLRRALARRRREGGGR